MSSSTGPPPSDPPRPRPNLRVVPIHQRPDLLVPCADLVNAEWKRSRAARVHSLQKSSSDFPVCLVLLQDQSLDSERLLGHARLSRVVGRSNSLFLESVVVSSCERGKGFGRALMEETERYARTRGFRRLYLTTHDKQHFYSHLGYVLSAPVQSAGALASLVPMETLLKFSRTPTRPPNTESRDVPLIVDQNLPLPTPPLAPPICPAPPQAPPPGQALPPPSPLPVSSPTPPSCPTPPICPAPPPAPPPGLAPPPPSPLPVSSPTPPSCPAPPLAPPICPAPPPGLAPPPPPPLPVSSPTPPSCPAPPPAPPPGLAPPPPPPLPVSSQTPPSCPAPPPPPLTSQKPVKQTLTETPYRDAKGTPIFWMHKDI